MIHCSICGHSHESTICPKCHGMPIPADDWKDTRIRDLEQKLAERTKERDAERATLSYVTRQLIEAGLDDGASPVEKMARRALDMNKQLARMREERDTAMKDLDDAQADIEAEIAQGEIYRAERDALKAAASARSK